MKIRLLFSLLVFFVFLGRSFAQLPEDLSKIKSAQIPDDQLIQLLQKSKESGQSEADILNVLKQRGLPDGELESLGARVRGLSQVSSFPNKNTSELLNGKGNRFISQAPNLSATRNAISMVFGAELFADASPLFSPNLSIATPLNYKVGPGDELLLEVFGTNVFTQKLIVSREGYINVRYAGLVNVNGVTIEDLATILKSRLAKFIPSIGSGSSKIQISLGNIRSITVNVMGAVKKPGTLTIPSLATLFNALYATGGPLDNGSFRTIELIRGNKKILEADLYDFLIKGNQSANVFLQDNDLIRVPFVQNQVKLVGLVNREAIFEAKHGEYFSDILQYAGGFKPNAYKGRVTGTRLGSFEKEIIDIAENQFTNFQIKNGDSISVSSIIDKFQNRVVIEGAVYKPGTYAWFPGQDLMDLIAKASGLKKDAFLGRVNILRTFDNLKKENISVDLNTIVNGNQKFYLQKEDQVTIFSSFELKNKLDVTVTGEVKKPGIYPFDDSLTLQQLLLKAGGFTDKSMSAFVEIARKKDQVDLKSLEQPVSEIIKVQLENDLSKSGSDFLLNPNDIITVKMDPAKRPQMLVSITGQVLFPGTYALETRQDRLSQILNRAGGILPTADQFGIKIIRKNLISDTASLRDVLKKQFSKLDSIAENKPLIGEGITEIAVEIFAENGKLNADRDILLQEGDVIEVPIIKNTVAITGEVLRPVNVQYFPGKGFNYYISSAGGYSVKAKKTKSFVYYTNGRSKRTTALLGLFKSYPKLLPGSTIVVPSKQERSGKFDPSKVGILVSALTTLATTLAILKGL
jgi:protein involved in polysaccharide export with SLBB domain